MPDAVAGRRHGMPWPARNMARFELHIVHLDRELKGHAPRFVRPEVEDERHLPRPRLGFWRHRDRQTALPVAVAEIEDHLVADDLNGVEASRGESVLFDLEEMGEVRADVDRKAQ